MELAAEEKPIKLGVKIEKPSDVKIHSFFQILAVLSLILIGLTAWLLVVEYLGDAPPSWLRVAIDNLSLSI